MRVTRLYKLIGYHDASTYLPCSDRLTLWAKARRAHLNVIPYCARSAKGAAAQGEIVVKVARA
jgi:hypothetical protein